MACLSLEDSVGLDFLDSTLNQPTLSVRSVSQLPRQESVSGTKRVPNPGTAGNLMLLNPDFLRAPPYVNREVEVRPTVILMHLIIHYFEYEHARGKFIYD